MLDQILVLIILIILSGFFSGVEIALFSLSNLKIRHLVERNATNAHIIKKLKDNPNRLLITILIGNNLVNISASVYATTVAMTLSSSNIIGIVTGVMTFLILVFGEIIPKTIATRHAQIISQMVARPLVFLEFILWPIIIIFEFISKLGNLFGKPKEVPEVTEEEVKTIIAAGEEAGEIKESEKEMIEKVFKFDDVNADEIMMPKTDMVVVKSTTSVKQALRKMTKTGYSRIPVFEKTKDNIIGILNIKDLVDALQKKKSNKKITDLMQESSFVPDTMKTDELLKHFKRNKRHMSIVVDEHGTVLGLVTLEDVLEEIVGDILDERDKVVPDVAKLAKNKWCVMGKMDIDDFAKRFKIPIRNDAEFDTVGGLIIDKVGAIPKEKDVLTINDYKIIVKQVKNNRVIEIKVIKK